MQRRVFNSVLSSSFRLDDRSLGNVHLFNNTSVANMSHKESAASTKYQYDAYIHYSLKDNVFVQQNMVSKLSGCRLVLHHRDVSHDADAIDAVVRSSEKVLLLASPEYMRSEVTQMELRIIMSKIVDAKNKVIIVSLSSTDTKKKLRNLVAGSECTILRWNDSSFWTKLRNQLPRNHSFCDKFSASLNDGSSEDRDMAKPSDYEDDLWTYVQKSSGGELHQQGNADSSISTRSTNADTSNATSNNTTTLPASLGQKDGRFRSNVIVNPIEAAATTNRFSGRNGPPIRAQLQPMPLSSAESDYVSVNDSLGRATMEPIYHTLEPPSPKIGARGTYTAGASGRRKKNSNNAKDSSMVYINADLEVVYPRPSNLQMSGKRHNNMVANQPVNRYIELLGERQGELEGFEDKELLVDDEYEDTEGSNRAMFDDEFLFDNDQCGYVPSPAPQSFQHSQNLPPLPSSSHYPAQTSQSYRIGQKRGSKNHHTYLI